MQSLENNIDIEELNKFSTLASHWWDKSGAFKSLHDINPLRVDYVADQADGLFAKTILDIGCGGGILSEALAAKGAAVTGIDMVEASIEVARLHLLESGVDVNYQLSTAEAWAEKHPQQYDVVCCLEMLEHVPDPASIVKSAAKLVKPGGTVVFSTINRNAKSFLMAIVAAEYVLNWVPRGTHDYKKLLKPFELTSMLDGTALDAEDLMGLHYNPLLNKYFLSNKNIDVNYFLACSAKKT
ncbi:MAG: bifunctional 2-polyprenyl-6-hydroxyphenol methylase/3-demethylubiquinol 3-O-methyltransferase UbiG [Pseudomonadota bacterium]